jgi:hypothetical protein
MVRKLYARGLESEQDGKKPFYPIFVLGKRPRGEQTEWGGDDLVEVRSSKLVSVIFQMLWSYKASQRLLITQKIVIKRSFYKIYLMDAIHLNGYLQRTIGIYLPTLHTTR